MFDVVAKMIQNIENNTNERIDLPLDGQGVTNVQAQRIAGLLNNDKSVKMIFTYPSLIGPEGAVAFAETLKNNNTITFLQLSRTGIGDDEAQIFAEAIKINSSLNALFLDSNQIGISGMKAIEDAMKYNKTITYISV